ncbi:hypothetical protein E4J93_05910 [Collinsella sp. BA40]|uniref:Ig-like domain-containing protein n=1 Tax=Collinsella sp. BA40 TaxID=2560852 RepID=UPI0011C7B3E8|nr:Ig-like domain-containing protein [Collinsella sp. BA40]TXF35906.1 hypothetical protein E4J93_05910 [Collinsella sp. BA40]
MTMVKNGRRLGGGRARRAVALVLCAGLVAAAPAAAGALESVPAGAQGRPPAAAQDAGAQAAQPAQMKIEDYLKSCWKERRTEVDLTPYNIDDEELNAVLFGIHYEEPEYYWIIRYQVYDTDRVTGKVTTYYPQYTDEVGTPFDRSEELEREWDVVRTLTENCTTDVEKALVVHDHLVRTITYSKKLGTHIPHDIEGGILEKQCVCEGYALAYKYYMNRLGIPCKVVSGAAGGESHAWNQIRIDGKWYMVDATWDDPNDSDHTVKHQFFLKSEHSFPRHDWVKDNFERCTDTTYDDAAWAQMSRNMAGHQGSLIVPGYFIGDDGLKTGIWKFDAKNLAAPGTLAIELNDQWELREGQSGIGLAEVSYYDGMLYYSTPKAVWRWDFSEPAKPEKVFELDKDDPDQIWYLHVADGKVYYETARYANDVRERREFVFDKDFQKVKHPIAVTGDVLELKVGGSPKGDFLRAAAPGALSFTSNDPAICEVEPIMGGKSVQLHPKKAGRTTVTVTATETDHYLPGTKDVAIVVTDDSQVDEQVTVSYEAGDNGSVAVVDSVTKEPVSNGAAVGKNSSLLYTATPAKGYAVKNWIVNGSVYREQGSVYTGTELVRTVTASTDHVKVEFAKAPVPLQGIALNKTALALEKGASEVLTVTLNPADTTDSKDVTWKSSNDAVATVDADGRVTAVGRGETVVTATSVAGGHTASCTVTVSEPEPEPKPEPQVDKGKLRAVFDECKVLDAKDYTTMTWHPFVAALDRAQQVLKDDAATQPQVDEALKGLQAARAGLKPVEKVAFSDVDKETAHRAEVEWLAANGISKGWENADGTSSFRPYATVKRADMAAFLYRLAGEPEFDAKDVAFADVDEKTPHRDAILWLAAEGISTGWKGADGKAEFRPYAEIARCDMAAFLYRMAGEPEFEAKDAFSDVARDTPHREAVLWLAASGVSTGWTAEDGTKTFRPYDRIVRCDMAAFLHRMAEKGLVDLR